MAKAASSVPKGYSTVTPALTLEDTRKAIDWYKKALGAEEQSISVGPDGKVMHAALPPRFAALHSVATVAPPKA